MLMTVLGCLFFRQSFGIIWWSPHSLDHSFWGGLNLRRIHIPLRLSVAGDQASQACTKPTTGFLPFPALVHLSGHRMRLLGLKLSSDILALAWPQPLTPEMNEVFRGLINVQKVWQWGHGAISSYQRAWRHLEVTFFRPTNRLRSRN